MTSYPYGWYLFLFHWKEEIHSFRKFIIENLEGGCNTPFGGRVTENASGGRWLASQMIYIQVVHEAVFTGLKSFGSFTLNQ